MKPLFRFRLLPFVLAALAWLGLAFAGVALWKAGWL